MIDIFTLIRTLESFASAVDVKESTLSHRIFKDTTKIGAMREGSDITVRRFNHAFQYMSDRWPDEVPRPIAIIEWESTSPDLMVRQK